MLTSKHRTYFDTIKNPLQFAASVYAKYAPQFSLLARPGH